MRNTSLFYFIYHFSSLNTFSLCFNALLSAITRLKSQDRGRFHAETVVPLSELEFTINVSNIEISARYNEPSNESTLRAVKRANFPGWTNPVVDWYSALLKTLLCRYSVVRVPFVEFHLTPLNDLATPYGIMWIELHNELYLLCYMVMQWLLFRRESNWIFGNDVNTSWLEIIWQ